MSATQIVRTTAFRLTEEHFGSVYVYRPTPRFVSAWGRLEADSRARGTENQRLPYRSLAVALRVSSGDFVALERRVADARAVIVSRAQLSPDALRMAFSAWEAYALERDDNPLSGLIDELREEMVSVYGLVRRRTGRCPTLDEGLWAWDVAIWEVAHRLASTPMRTDAGQVRLRLDSDASLLTWEDRISSPDDPRYTAMHRIVPMLITIPGIEAPVISLQSSLVRLAPTWSSACGVKYAWADTDSKAPLLRARLRHRPTEEHGWTTSWADRATNVLDGARLRPLPNPEADPDPAGPLRAGFGRPPRVPVIGRGVGQWFHECVAHHARGVLGPAAEPVVLERVRPSWPGHTKAAPRPPFYENGSVPSRRLLLVYANASVRRRMIEGLAHVLAADARANDLAPHEARMAELASLEDGQWLRCGPLEVLCIRPPEADQWLLRRNEAADTIAWLDSWLTPHLPASGIAAAFVETDADAARGDDDLADPKHVLRAELARRRVVTQFLDEASAPRRRREGEFSEHAAANAFSDLLRSAGLFLRPFPAIAPVEAGTLVVGIYVTRVTRRTWGTPRFLFSLVAVAAGEQTAWGYVDRRWLPLDEATAAFLGSDHDHDRSSVSRSVESAIEQLRLAHKDRRLILVFDAFGCRRLWSCLADRSAEGPDAWMGSGNTAVVRARAVQAEVVRAAGVGGWDGGLAPATYTEFRPMSVVRPEGNGPTFVLSGSAVMGTVRSARDSTRFAANPDSHDEDWHALGATELLVLAPGPWAPDAVIAQVAMMCRIAPTWDRTLRWPSPLHLARAIVRDHPGRNFVDGEEMPEDGDARLDHIT